MCATHPYARIISISHIYTRGVIVRKNGVLLVLVCEHDAEPQLRGDSWCYHRLKSLSHDCTHPDVRRRVGEWVSTAYVVTSDGSGLIYVIPAVA